MIGVTFTGPGVLFYLQRLSSAIIAGQRAALAVTKGPQGRQAAPAADRPGLSVPGEAWRAR
jgi:hypothetical protein